MELGELLFGLLLRLSLLVLELQSEALELVDVESHPAWYMFVGL